MRLEILSLFAAVILVGACETAPEETAETSSMGTTSSSTSTATSESTESTALPAPEAGSQEDLTVQVGDRVFFAFDSSELSGEAQDTLQRLAAWMQANPSVTITIEGHCDERGTREYNLALGERRASAARDFVVALGIDPNRLDTISYGCINRGH